ncbi:hypothetical protein [Desulfosoma sp.]
MQSCHSCTNHRWETSENLFVDDFFRKDCSCAEDAASPSTGDNRDELFRKFRLSLDPSHQRFVAGYQWFCQVCGKPAASAEAWFACRQKFVTVKVVCHLGCFSHWRLKIHAQRPAALAQVC